MFQNRERPCSELNYLSFAFVLETVFETVWEQFKVQDNGIFLQRGFMFLLVASRCYQLVVTLVQVQDSRFTGLCRCSEPKLLVFVRISFLFYLYPEVITLQGTILKVEIWGALSGSPSQVCPGLCVLFPMPYKVTENSRSGLQQIPRG